MRPLILPLLKVQYDFDAELNGVNVFKMASTVNEIVAQVKENLTEYQNATTARVPSTPEGMAIAYGSLIIMAILPIFFGSYRAVKHHKEQQVSHVL